MKKFLLLPLLTSFMQLASQCKNDDDNKTPLAPIDQLPPPTREGKNKFGCLVNGRAWVPRTTSDMVAIYQQGVLQIGAGLDTPDESLSLVLNEDNLSINNKYILNNPPEAGAEFIRITESKICWYELENTLEGYLILTRFDNINYIISGEFEFTTVNTDCDTIRVTDGRFDIKYIP